MKEYEIRHPDTGKIYEIRSERPPTEAQLREAIASIDAKQQAANVEPERFMGNTAGLRQAGIVANGFNRGLANTLGIPVDLVNSALNKMGLGGDEPFGGSRHLRNKLNQIGTAVDLPEGSSTSDKVFDRVGTEMGATALPAAGVLGNADRLSRSSRPFLSQLGSSVSNNPGRFISAETAAATGAGIGASIANEIAPGSQGAEITGQLLGGFTPAIASDLTRRAIRGGEQGRQAIQESIDEFAAAGTSPTLAEASGSKWHQVMEQTLKIAPISNNVIAEASEQAQRDIGDRINAISTQLAGNRANAVDAGVTIQRGITGQGGFVDRFNARANELYSRLDEHIPSDAAIASTNTSNYLNTSIAPIDGAQNLSNSNLLRNPTLQNIAESLDADLAVGQLSYNAIRQLRTRVGEKISNPSLFDDVSKRELQGLYGALSDDLRAAAVNQGQDAVRAFDRANNYYRAASRRLEDGLKPIVSKIERAGFTPEQVYQTALSGSKEGGSRLFTLKRSLTRDEWSVVSGSVLQRLGRANNSAQNDLGEVFNVETYLTNWNKLSNPAKEALFEGTRRYSLGSDLDMIASAASKIKDKNSVLRNSSGTAGAGVSSFSYLYAALNVKANPVGVFGTAIGLRGSAELATNPRFIRWLARSTEVPMEQLPSHISRLANTVKKDDAYGDAVAEYLLNFDDSVN